MKERWMKQYGRKDGWKIKGENEIIFFIHFKLPPCNQGLKFLVSFGCYDLHVLVAFVECFCWVVKDFQVFLTTTH
jgi:hypothetical protein